jgi:hypothetical protein
MQACVLLKNEMVNHAKVAGFVFDSRNPAQHHQIPQQNHPLTRAHRHRKMIMAAAPKYGWQTKERKLLQAYAQSADAFKRQ